MNEDERRLSIMWTEPGINVDLTVYAPVDGKPMPLHFMATAVRDVVAAYQQKEM